jgi:predicted protein tyrosine phosphatase|tara:strand:- start:152 stop:310 length:159 start_codon:yes stop_codon:yes gene_type:complete
MKLSIDETEHVLLALNEWAVINVYDKKLHKDIKRLEKRFALSLKKKREKNDV